MLIFLYQFIFYAYLTLFVEKCVDLFFLFHHMYNIIQGSLDHPLHYTFLLYTFLLY